MIIVFPELSHPVFCGIMSVEILYLVFIRLCLNAPAACWSETGIPPTGLLGTSLKIFWKILSAFWGLTWEKDALWFYQVEFCIGSSNIMGDKPMDIIRIFILKFIQAKKGDG